MTIKDLRSFIICLTVLFLMVVGTAQMGRAQAVYGSIVGHVSDPSGAAITTANVTALNTVTKKPRTTTTDAIGGYNFPTVEPGTYDVTVRMAGFTTSVQPGIVVTAQSTVRVDVALILGAVTQSVTVNGAALQMQTDRSDVKTELGNTQVANLPLPLGRNYQNLLAMVPGFSVPQISYNSTAGNPSKSLVFNVNGSSYSNNNTKIDGATSQNVFLVHDAAYVPTLESIQDVTVMTNSYDAETGMVGGGAIYVQTKSGTNQFHGALFEEHDDNHLNAREFFSQSVPGLVDNEFGGALGGPIKKEKLFFFVSYEGTFDHEGTARYGTVPTAAMKQGDFSGSSNPIYNPFTGNATTGAGRTAFSGNLIPQSSGLWDPIATKLVALTPNPNVPGNLLTNNYYTTANYIFDRHRVDAKVNWNPSEKMMIFGRFGMLHSTADDPETYGALGGPPISSASLGGIATGNVFTATAGITRIFSPTFVMDARWAWTPYHVGIVPHGGNVNLGLQFGIPGVNGPADYQAGWPMFAVSGFDTIGTASNSPPYFWRLAGQNELVNFDKVKGPHDIRFGADILQLANNIVNVSTSSPFGSAGGFQFNGGPTTIPGGPGANQFNDYANFLLGLSTRLGKNTLLENPLTTRAQEFGLYVRDRWAMTPKLTVNYGVRWEFYPMPTRANPWGGLPLYNPQTNETDICGYGVVPRSCNIGMSKHEFAPRLGIAYRVSKNLVLRTGYGISTDPYSLARPLVSTYPASIIQDYTSANPYVWAGTLAQGIPVTPTMSLGNGIMTTPTSLGLYTPPMSQYKRPYAQSWNLTLEKQFRGGFTGQAAYVATRSTNQGGYLDINAAQTLGGGLASQPLYKAFGRTASTYLTTPVGNSEYDALQIQVRRQFAQGLQFGVNYTFSKALGVATGDDSVPQINALQYYQLNRALLSFDRTHNLGINAVWKLPFGKGRALASSGVGAAILGGWQVSGVSSIVSGTPFTVTASGSSLNMASNNQRANQLVAHVQKLGGVGPGQPYFDPLAFGPVTTAAFGTAGYYSMRGPGFINLDTSLSREIAIRERFKLMIRADAFNFTNSPAFSNPSANVSNLVLNSNGTVKSLGSYDQITGVQNLGRDFESRRIRVSLHLNF